MPREVEILMKEAMKREGYGFLRAELCQREAARVRHANGFEPAQVDSRMVTLSLRIPQLLEGIRFLILVARYEKVRHGDAMIDCPVLIAAGVRHDVKRLILSVSVSWSEAEVRW